MMKSLGLGEVPGGLTLKVYIYFLLMVMPCLYLKIKLTFITTEKVFLPFC